MNITDQRICLWLVPVFGIVLAIAFCTAGFLPPPSPTLSAEAVAAFYRDNLTQIRAGMITANLFGIMFIPFFMVIVVQMLRMANGSRAFAYAYLSGVASSGSIFLLAILCCSMAAFRPERDPQFTLMLNDLACMAFVSPVGFVIWQNMFLAGAIYLDGGAKPVFPRWVAHFNVATALMMIPGAFSLMYKEGPLAWDGSLAFGLHFSGFAVYLAVMFFAVRAALNQQESETATSTSAVGALA
jgi:hypothetical protein